jgi:hypothetical protein
MGVWAAAGKLWRYVRRLPPPNPESHLQPSCRDAGAIRPEFNERGIRPAPPCASMRAPIERLGQPPLSAFNRLLTNLMNRQIAEWLWRVAIICALGWIGWELHQIHLELLQPVDEATTAASPDGLQDSLDDLSAQVATLNEKVDAIMIAMMQLKR